MHITSSRHIYITYCKHWYPRKTRYFLTISNIFDENINFSVRGRHFIYLVGEPFSISQSVALYLLSSPKIRWWNERIDWLNRTVSVCAMRVRTNTKMAAPIKKYEFWQIFLYFTYTDTPSPNFYLGGKSPIYVIKLHWFNLRGRSPDRVYSVIKWQV